MIDLKPETSMIPLFASALIDAMRNSVALERNTLHPWVITAQYLGIGLIATQRLIKIVQAPLRQRPDAQDHLPVGAIVLTEDSFPAERFAGMALEVRPRYRAQYEAFLMWRKAHALGKPRAEMVPHVDYDPVAIEAKVAGWIRPGSNPLGD